MWPSFVAYIVHLLDGAVPEMKFNTMSFYLNIQ